MLVNGGCLAYASQSDWVHAQLLAVRLLRPHRALAQAIGRLPQAASGACPRPHRALAQAAPGRTPGIYLCCVDWAHSQSLWPGTHPGRTGSCPGIYASYVTGRIPVLRCCLPAVCHKWSGALPPLASATTRHTPRLGALPSLRWQRKRLPCQPHLAIVYAISYGWSDPMASILPKIQEI